MTIDRQDPEAVVRAAALAMHEERWADVAALCDARALVRRKLRMLEALAPREPVDFYTFRRQARDVPDDVARWMHERQRAHDGEPMRRARLRAYGVASLAELDALSPATLFARELDAGSPRSLARAQVGHGADLGEYGATLLYPVVRVLGHVRERLYGREVAHVLTRVVHPAAEVDPHAPDAASPILDAEDAIAIDYPPQVAALLRGDDGTWGIAPSHDFLGLGTWGVAIGERVDEIAEAKDWEGEPPDA
jgi:hypothetical protein